MKTKLNFNKIASFLQKIEDDSMSEKTKNEKTETYDIVVIGGGPGGYHAAIRASQYGAKVALIERSHVGGTCLNRGCIPTKALYSSAKLLEDIKEKCKTFGIKLPTPPEVDFEQVVERKNKLVSKMVGEIEQLLKKCDIDYYQGHGSILGGEIDDGFDLKIKGDKGTKPTKIKGKRVIIATGSVPALIPQFNIDHERILTSDDILSSDFKIIPKSLLIIGGGVIGCEFAYIFGQLGAKVTVLEYLDSILATEEKLIVKELKKKFEKMGISIYEKMNCLSVRNTGEKVEISACSSKIPTNQVEAADKKHFTADYCIVSIGRAKFIKNLGIENSLIQTDRGRILVDRLTLETDELGIYAIGDVTGGLMLAHVASYEGDIAVYNALASLGFDVEPARATYEVVPSTIFTNPEIGTVGLKEKIARRRGYKTFVGRFAYAALGKAKCEGEEDGFMMVIADQDTDVILGASCIGAEAPELIAEIALAINNNLTVHDVIETIHSHPTMSELVLETCEDVHGLAIHKARRRREPVITPIEVSPEILASFLFPNMDFKAIIRG